MKIYVSRPKQWADMFCAYMLHIDGKKVAKIRRGQTIGLNIPDGASILSGKINWCSSNEIDIAELSPDDKLEIKNSFSPEGLSPYVPIYYVTFGRKKYLKLEICT